MSGPTQLSHYFLDDIALATLRGVVGHKLGELYADHLHLDLATGEIQCRSIVINARPETGRVVALATDWVQTRSDDFHGLIVTESDTPTSVALTLKDGRVVSMGPCSSVAIPDRGLLQAIDVIRYDQDTFWNVPDGTLETRAETVSYDRALVFRFTRGEPLTVTTAHGSILGAFEIRQGRKPGFDHDDGRFSTRITLN